VIASRVFARPVSDHFFLLLTVGCLTLVFLVQEIVSAEIDVCAVLAFLTDDIWHDEHQRRLDALLGLF